MINIKYNYLCKNIWNYLTVGKLVCKQISSDLLKK